MTLKFDEKEQILPYRIMNLCPLLEMKVCVVASDKSAYFGKELNVAFSLGITDYKGMTEYEDETVHSLPNQCHTVVDLSFNPEKFDSLKRFQLALSNKYETGKLLWVDIHGHRYTYKDDKGATSIISELSCSHLDQ